MQTATIAQPRLKKTHTKKKPRFLCTVALLSADAIHQINAISLFHFNPLGRESVLLFVCLFFSFPLPAPVLAMRDEPMIFFSFLFFSFFFSNRPRTFEWLLVGQGIGYKIYFVATLLSRDRSISLTLVDESLFSYNFFYFFR